MLIRVLCFICIAVVGAGAAEWKAIDTELLQLKTPKLNPNADAEAVFWDSYVYDVSAGNGYLNHMVENYVRIKLYNEKGIERFGNVEIPYSSEKRMSLVYLMARTILPNGKVIEVSTKDMNDQLVEKTGRRKFSVKSFAMPALEPGAVIEYQWTEVYSEYVPRYVELEMQREFPAWHVVYHVKPYTGNGFSYQMNAYPFNCKPEPWKPLEGDGRHQGFVTVELRDLPALEREPMMPAEDDVKAWILIYYTETKKQKPDSYWPGLGKDLAGKFKARVKVNEEMRKVAQDLTAGMESESEKADALARYCQTKVKNVFHPGTGVTSEERVEFFKQLKVPHHTTDTLKLGKGTPEQILALFYALSEAAGLKPVYIRAGTGNGPMFRADFLDPYLLRNQLVGFAEGEKYRVYNPAIPYLPPGMADWDEQGQAALVVDGKGGKLLLLPPADETKSEVKRRAKLEIDEQGKVMGAVEIVYTGHFAVSQKRRLEQFSAGAVNEELKKQWEEKFPGAAVQGLTVGGLNEPLEPLRVKFAVSMEGYGQRTGKRLLWQPAFFQYAEKPLFPAAKRQYPVYFRHPYTETDDVEWEYPDGFELESPEMPAPIRVDTIGELRLEAGLAKGLPRLTVKRKFFWGRGHQGYFPTEQYTAVKKIWDSFHSIDSHVLTLRAAQ